MSAQTISKSQVLQQYMAYGAQINTSPLSFMSAAPETVAQQAVNEFQREGGTLIKVDRGITMLGGLSFTVWAAFNTPDGMTTIDEFAQALLLKVNRAMLFAFPGPTIGGTFLDPTLVGPFPTPQPGLQFSPVLLIAAGIALAFFFSRRS